MKTVIYSLPESPVYYEVRVEIPDEEMEYFCNSLELLDEENKGIFREVLQTKDPKRYITWAPNTIHTIRCVLIDSEEFSRWVTFVKLGSTTIRARVLNKSILSEYISIYNKY